MIYIYTQEWNSCLETLPKANIYRLFKTEHTYETYLNILALKYGSMFTRFSICSNIIPSEPGRWSNIRNERIYCICNQLGVGDELHFMFECKALKDIRKRYLTSYYCKDPNIIKLHLLFNSRNKETIINLSLYLKYGLKMM